MFTLIVNGVAVVKLQKRSEIPSRRGEESWKVIDEDGNTVEAYAPPTAARVTKSASHRGNRLVHAAELAFH